MARCTRIRRKKRRVCIGDLNEEIVLQNRNLTAPAFQAVDFEEEFEDNGDAYAAIDTVTGKTFFDGVNTDSPVTHEIYIVFDTTVTAQSWVEFDSRRIDILKVENFEERNEFMLLTCVERGLISRAGSRA